MSPEELLALANRKIGIYDVGTLANPSESPEVYETTRIDTTFNGHDVRVEFLEYRTGHPSYRFNAVVYDSDTGDVIATGNGGKDWSEAFDIVHWQNVVHHWN